MAGFGEPDRPEIEPTPPGLGSHPMWICGPNGRLKLNVKIGGFAVARPKGSRTVLLRIPDDTIGELAGGIAGDTARQYAQRGQFDSRVLDSLLTWVNDRRTEKGLPLIGL